MRHLAKHRERHLVIDRLTCLMRQPTAAPLLMPDEVIAVVLNMTEWIPGDRLLDPEDIVVQEIKRGLRLAGYSITPTEVKKEG
jgi:hypothetical protein